ncbi:hypothetical protein B0T21DRAFT_119094 [Apiosordaria backusii]|uniref:Uncharacterized protein n=1 Tax=Apiosordaria backusii TaxID=314023 RepID=A0AA40ELX3_9PEZI|nr:hypothetical protein B0T21DRAFT_119094 [Apiosordaria backusii]
MRAEALRRAIEEGSFPADALLSDDDDTSVYNSSSGSNGANDDKRSSTQYSYAIFHVIFFLATA